MSCGTDTLVHYWWLDLNVVLDTVKVRCFHTVKLFFFSYYSLYRHSYNSLLTNYSFGKSIIYFVHNTSNFFINGLQIISPVIHKNSSRVRCLHKLSWVSYSSSITGGWIPADCTLVLEKSNTLVLYANLYGQKYSTESIQSVGKCCIWKIISISDLNA